MSNKNRCPICGYKFKMCQCRFAGSAHPDRDKQMSVVNEHLYLLSVRQIIHVLKLQKFWQISYGDNEKELMLKRLVSEGTTE